MTAATDDRTPADHAAELRRQLAVYRQKDDVNGENVKGFEAAVELAEDMAGDQEATT